MFTSFSTALSALKANSTGVDVVGNNLANLNTPGYKASVVYFRDLVTQSLGAGLGETQVGFGTGTPLTVRQFSQGSIQTSSGLLDAAIQGDGFFIVKDAQGASLYTRAGGFQLDLAGNLLTNTGQKVQGWTTVDAITGAVNTSGPIGDIVVPVGALKPAKVTQNLSVDMNLNATAAVGASSDFETSVVAYDSLGAPHVLTIHFEKTDTNTWQYDVTMNGAEATAGKAGTPFAIPSATGKIKFDAEGKLTDPAAGAPIAIAITGLVSGATDLNINWNLYNDAGAARLTQFGQPTAVSANAQDGWAAAQLVRVGLANGGQILAQYSDGQQTVVGQVALASIRNPESLIAVGNNNFQTSSKSAAAAIGVPNTGGRGSVLGGALEYSTVDIATEFTNMIVFQRGYEAGSKVITTADQLSQDTINLIR